MRAAPRPQTLTPSLLALAQGPPADERSLAPRRARNKKPRARGARGAVLESSLPRGARPAAAGAFSLGLQGFWSGRPARERRGDFRFDFQCFRALRPRERFHLVCKVFEPPQTLTPSLLALAQGPPADKCSLAPLGAQNKKPPPRGGRGAVLKSSLPRARAPRPLGRFCLFCKVFGAAGPRGSGAAIFRFDFQCFRALRPRGRFYLICKVFEPTQMLHSTAQEWSTRRFGLLVAKRAC